MRTVNLKKKEEQYQDAISRLYPELHQEGEDGERILSRTVTWQVTDECNLVCSYCYQVNKGHRVMSLETAKKMVDALLTGEKGFGRYVNPRISPAIMLEFIGGEPFLQVELIDQIVDYFRSQAIVTGSPWADRFKVSICSNGTLYFKPEVKRFIEKHKAHLSFSVTIDGNKELHDSCRVFPDGSPSYDLAVAAAKDWMERGNFMGSKITIAPQNVRFLDQALRHMIGLGYDIIHANCVYEEGWTLEHAKELYRQMKSYADYVLEQDLVDKVYCSLFEEEMFHPKAEDDLQTWCGGTGDMLAMDPDGYLYPCIRYMESSLGTVREPLRIGHIDTGLGLCPEHRECIRCMKAVDRRTQSTEECFSCPIAEGCSYCSAYNYQVFGTPDSRVTYICIMHKARSLANSYYWNSYYRKRNLPYRFKIYAKEEWGLEIVGRKEWEYLKRLEAAEKLEKHINELFD